MSEILFGQSYYLRFDPKLWGAMQPYPPLGTLYAASYLRNQGYEIALFDAMLAESEGEWGLALDQHQPKFAVIYEDNFNYLSKMCLLRMRQAAFKMISMARERNCTVIVAGSDASDHPGEYIEEGADFVLIGEGERTLGELIGRLTGRNEQPFESILGLAWKSEDAHGDGLHVKINLPRPEIRDLDTLPFPAWDLVNIPRYRDIWQERHGFYSMNMVTTRGCPFHCNWCAKPIWGQRYSVRSPENVVAEMKWLKDTFHPDHIWFVDDIFALKPGWAARFAQLVEDQDLKIPFKCLNRADLLLRQGEIEALKQAGCQIVWVGAESGSQKILDAMDKGTKVEQIYEATQRLHASGIQVGFFLQFGYPGEDRADINKTLKMVRECRPDDIGMSVSYPLPGTKFHAAVKEQLGKKRNWGDSNDLAMLHEGPFNTAFYRQLHSLVHKEFRMRKAWYAIIDWRKRKPKNSGLNSGARLDSFAAIKTLLKNALTLPIARWRLKQLMQAPHARLELRPQTLTPEEAARPSPQPDSLDGVTNEPL
jgi:anaerobic magnesium-protoporphyrin IX monomethyl ester cyclase